MHHALQALDIRPVSARRPAGYRWGASLYGRAALAGVPAPTLVVHGESESIPMDLVQQWVTALPHATLLRVPRAAHFTYSERPELVWPVVERFLSR